MTQRSDAGGPPGSAAGVIEDLRVTGLSVGTAESLTGGLVCAALTSVPGSSAVVRGGVVAYANDVKAGVLGVDAGLLARDGAVTEEVGRRLAEGARRVLRCDVGLATTGVAGPDPADGRPVGTVVVAASGPWGILVEEHALTGDRATIRAASVDAVLVLVHRALRNLRDAVGPAGYGGLPEHDPTPEHDPITDEREEAP